LSSTDTQSQSCEVDFYLLGDASKGADRLACQLALMAWERNQKIFIVTSTESSARQLDELMWHSPEGRFLPHAVTEAAGGGLPADSCRAPVNIGTLSSLNPADVVINLCPEAVPQPQRFSRVLEIVPYASDEREASRVKFKTYRSLGLNPRMQENNS
jgi:DNA polymerase-3 subunit chi